MTPRRGDTPLRLANSLPTRPGARRYWFVARPCLALSVGHQSAGRLLPRLFLLIQRRGLIHLAEGAPEGLQHALFQGRPAVFRRDLL
jgi:hypothetical protein